MTTNNEINEEKMGEFMGKMLTDMGAAAGASLILVGDQLGLYKTLHKYGPFTSQQLADATETTERYVREWLAAQAVAGYVTYNAADQTFSMSPEQAAVFADEDSPFYSVGGFYGICSLAIDEPKLTQAFKTGEGIGWGDHHECLFCGTAKFFRPGYKANLVSEWIPALDGLHEKLQQGGKAADVGCGHGVSTLIMAEAYPNSEFIGYDFHGPSVEAANAHAKEAGLSNVSFHEASAKTYHGSEYDLVTFFDCLHDMGDPVGACKHVLSTLKPDGHLMLVEPFAGDSLEENINPVGRVYYNFSTAVCTPASISQEVGLALGAQAGQKRLGDVVTEGGFTRYRRATETAFNLILEARP